MSNTKKVLTKAEMIKLGYPKAFLQRVQFCQLNKDGSIAWKLGNKRNSKWLFEIDRFEENYDKLKKLCQ